MEIIYLVVPTAVPRQARPPLEALSAAGAAETGVALLVDLLVVAEEPGQPEGFSAGVADVPLLLCVNAHVITQSHVVGIRLIAEVAPEISRLVGVLVVEQTAGMLVRAATEVAAVGSFVRTQVHSLHAEA